MAFDGATAERVRRVLSERPHVVEKKMMGGLIFMVNGSMCCGINGTDLMVRVGPEALEQALAQPHVRPMEIGGRRLAAFVKVDLEGYRTDTALRTWIARGIDFVSALPTRKPTVGRSRRKGQRR